MEETLDRLGNAPSEEETAGWGRLQSNITRRKRIADPVDH